MKTSRGDFLHSRHLCLQPIYQPNPVFPLKSFLQWSSRSFSTPHWLQLCDTEGFSSSPAACDFLWIRLFARHETRVPQSGKEQWILTVLLFYKPIPSSTGSMSGCVRMSVCTLRGWFWSKLSLLGLFLHADTILTWLRWCSGMGNKNRE